MSTKVMDLAKANIESSDVEQAIKSLQRQVRDNQHSWANSKVVAERNVECATDKVDALKSCTTATAEEYIRAVDTLALAERNLEMIEKIATERF